jgi:hypothetical protein
VPVAQKIVQVSPARLDPNKKYLRPLENVPFFPISVSDLNFNRQNTKCIPVVKIFVFFDLEQN